MAEQTTSTGRKTTSAAKSCECETCLSSNTEMHSDVSGQNEVNPAWEAIEGTPIPLGVNWLQHQQAWNAAIYSRHATRVTLLLFDENIERPSLSVELNPLWNKSGAVWHCRIANSVLPGAQYYAWQIDGPPPGAGYDWHAFDSEKLLLDPYARAIFFPPTFSRDAARVPGSNMGRAALAILEACRHISCPAPGGQIRHGADLVIYEMHVRGFTQHPGSGVAAQNHGTFAGIIEKIPYLSELGVTAIELMPIFQFDPDNGDYWGYMPLSFFAPHHEYSKEPDHCPQQSEFRQLVDALHAAGIEVILDVVFNHTCEGDQQGPTYGLKGIDNSSYYVTTGNADRPYANFSGTGNTLHTANHAVRQLIVDSLRYWVIEMGVDGFRFDLASVFTRNSDGSINTVDPPVFSQIAGDPVLRHVRMIAEPWDAGGAYQLGHSFPGTLWMQWNACYRDTLQRFVRGDAGMVTDLMTRVYGSADLFPDDTKVAMRPLQSVNYVNSHDGFTLYDLVSYNRRRNWANGHNNTDGANDYSWNCGWEGDENVPDDVLNLRRRQARNIFCLLLLSNGTPMFRMGDEFLQTQQGNNNPFNQDNEATWLDWSRLDANAEIFRFASRMIAFRKSHPSLSRSRFWREDIYWYGPERFVDMSPESRTLAWCLHGNSVGDDDIYVMVNSSEGRIEFGIFEGTAGEWKRVIDTSLPSPDDICDIATQPSISESAYFVGARSVVVLVRKKNTVQSGLTEL